MAAAVALALTGQIGGALLHADAPVVDEIRSVPIRLAVPKGFSARSARALTAEAAAIWRRSGIELHWLTSEAADPSLRVLVTHDPIAKHAGDAEWTLGELLRFEDRAALAVVSLAGALRIVNSDRPWLFFDDRGQHEHRLGVVLGRGVAHEVGHFLLRTDTHAASGLMRATIGAREFADVERPFQLDPVAQAHLAQLAVTPVSQAPRFSYNAR